MNRSNKLKMEGVKKKRAVPKTICFKSAAGGGVCALGNLTPIAFFFSSREHVCSAMVTLPGNVAAHIFEEVSL